MHHVLRESNSSRHAPFSVTLVFAHGQLYFKGMLHSNFMFRDFHHWITLDKEAHVN
jgi:hypothetical protein